MKRITGIAAHLLALPVAILASIFLAPGDIGEEEPKSSNLLEFLFVALRKHTAEEECNAAGVF